jgi:hypothetical protein
MSRNLFNLLFSRRRGTQSPGPPLTPTQSGFLSPKGGGGVECQLSESTTAQSFAEKRRNPPFHRGSAFPRRLAKIRGEKGRRRRVLGAGAASRWLSSLLTGRKRPVAKATASGVIGSGTVGGGRRLLSGLCGVRSRGLNRGAAGAPGRACSAAGVVVHGRAVPAWRPRDDELGAWPASIRVILCSAWADAAGCSERRLGAPRSDEAVWATLPPRACEF